MTESLGLINGKATKLYLSGDKEGLKKLVSTLPEDQVNAVRSHLKTIKQLRKKQ